MIKINLAERKNASTAAAAAGGGGGGLFGGFKFSLGGGGGGAAGADLSEATRQLVRDVLVRIALFVALYFAGDQFVIQLKEQTLASLRQEIATIEGEAAKLDSELSKRAVYEQEKNAIEEAEKAQLARMAAIDKLILGRDAELKLLRELSAVLPPELWLRSVELDPKEIAISGTATSVEQVTQLIRALDLTSHYKDAQPRMSEELDAVTGRAFQQFDIREKRRGSDE